MRRIILLASVTAAVVCVFLFSRRPFLIVASVKKPKEYITFPLDDGGFSVCYTHSVNKGRVRDFYCRKGENLIIYKTQFVSYGAGMPEIEETPGAEFFMEDDVYTMKYTRFVGKQMLLAVGVTADHSIIVDEKEYFLKDYFPVQTRLAFKISKKLPVKTGGIIDEKKQ